jgi:hypothetical protein
LSSYKYCFKKEYHIGIEIIAGMKRNSLGDGFWRKGRTDVEMVFRRKAELVCE